MMEALLAAGFDPNASEFCEVGGIHLAWACLGDCWGVGKRRRRGAMRKMSSRSSHRRGESVSWEDMALKSFETRMRCSASLESWGFVEVALRSTGFILWRSEWDVLDGAHGSGAAKDCGGHRRGARGEAW